MPLLIERLLFALVHTAFSSCYYRVAGGFPPEVFYALPYDDDPYGGCLARIFRFVTYYHISEMLFCNLLMALSPPRWADADNLSCNFNLYVCLSELLCTVFVLLPIRVGLLGIATFVLA